MNADNAGPEAMKSTDQDVTKDFFISYNRRDVAWAEWIAWTLENNGYTTIIQAWDFMPGGNFVLDMNEALKTSRKTLLVLSESFLNSKFTPVEFAATFARDPQGRERAVIPFRVDDCEPTGLLGAINYVDLFDSDEKEATAALLSAFGDRRKPSGAVPFPKVRSDDGRQVTLRPKHFPGKSHTAKGSRIRRYLLLLLSLVAIAALIAKSIDMRTAGFGADPQIDLDHADSLKEPELITPPDIKHRPKATAAKSSLPPMPEGLRLTEFSDYKSTDEFKGKEVVLQCSIRTPPADGNCVDLAYRASTVKASYEDATQTPKLKRLSEGAFVIVQGKFQGRIGNLGTDLALQNCRFYSPPTENQESVATKKSTPQPTTPLPSAAEKDDISLDRWKLVVERQYILLTELAPYKLRCSQRGLSKHKTTNLEAVCNDMSRLRKVFVDHAARMDDHITDIGKLGRGETMGPASLDSAWRAYFYFISQAPAESVIKIFQIPITDTMRQGKNYFHPGHPEMKCDDVASTVRSAGVLMDWCREKQYVPRLGSDAYQCMVKVLDQIAMIADQQIVAIDDVLRDIRMEKHDCSKPLPLMCMPKDRVIDIIRAEY